MTDDWGQFGDRKKVGMGKESVKRVKSHERKSSGWNQCDNGKRVIQFSKEPQN